MCVSAVRYVAYANDVKHSKMLHKRSLQKSIMMLYE